MLFVGEIAFLGESTEEIYDEEGELSDDGGVAHEATEGSGAPDGEMEGAFEPEVEEEFKEFEVCDEF